MITQSNVWDNQCYEVVIKNENKKIAAATSNKNKTSIGDLSDMLVQSNQPSDGVKVFRNCVELSSGHRGRLFSFFECRHKLGMSFFKIK